MFALKISVILFVVQSVTSKSFGQNNTSYTGFSGYNNTAGGYGSNSHGYPASSGLSGHGNTGGHSYPPSSVGSKSGITSSHGYTPFGQTQSGSYGSGHGISSSHVHTPFGSSGFKNSSFGSPSGQVFARNVTNSYTNPSSGFRQNFTTNQAIKVVSKPSYSSNHKEHSSWSSHSSNSHSGSHSKPHKVHHHHYHYQPPQQIVYAPLHGPPVTYPVYHGSLPNYVYQAQDSDSKFGTLIAGLALLNLGTIAATGRETKHKLYIHPSSETCKFGVRRDTGYYEEGKIDCQLITHFIFEEESKGLGTNLNIPTYNAPDPVSGNLAILPNGSMVLLNPGDSNGTPQTAGFVQANNAGQATLVPGPGHQVILPNGILVSQESLTTTPRPYSAAGNLNAATSLVDRTMADAMNTIRQHTADANKFSLLSNSALGHNTMSVNTNAPWTISSSANTNIVNALDVKGRPVDVTPGMLCYIIRSTPFTNTWKAIPCEVLQQYAVQSLKNSAGKNVFSIAMLAVVLAGMLL